MPEGDTIFRAAATLRAWIGQRTVSAARSSFPGVQVGALVGRTVASVTPVGKHVLMQFDDPSGNDAPLLLRTHMRMTGSWHVYAAGAPWQRPARQASLVIETGDRLAVCFNVPVVELTVEAADTARGVAHLGPDILAVPFDVAETIVRARGNSQLRAVGEVLLDQRVVAGIGNIYRCESLHLERVSPWSAVGTLDNQLLQAILRRAEQLMKQNLNPARLSRNLDAGADQTWVYRRTGFPCRSCETPILSKPQGDQARVAYWCPVCQPKGALPRS